MIVLDGENNEIQFTFKKDGERNGSSNVKDDVYNFVFNGVLDQLTQQETVFNKIAKDVCISNIITLQVADSCFDGYNGTIFAYGQTGSGKTYTITGGTERYADRGIIPRTISYIFNEIQKRNTYQYKVSVSYLEIYNDAGYDLLDENHATKSLFDLPKVKMYEVSDDQFVLKNLSVHRAENEEDALNLLFIGDTNRVVSTTPKNDASTRSHCIFIIQLESQKMGEDIKTTSKLHLVDLSGSERPSQTGIDGKTLEEAKNINVSLHYLAQVIECLNEKAKGKHVTHIPYRNSMMTMVLRDSLGGNCKTKMIATVSAEKEDVYESLSTCRFAKRVSKIQNLVSRNEQADPGVIIQRLKKEVSELKAEIALLKGGDQKEHLTSEDIDRCNKMVEEFIDSNDPSKTLVLPDRLMINQCFYHFKHLLRDMAKKKGGTGMGGPNFGNASPQKTKEDSVENKNMSEEIQRLQILVQQRDNEIGILLNYLNKKKGPGDDIQGLPVHRSEALTYSQKEESKSGGTLYSMMNQSSQKKEYDVIQTGVHENPASKKQQMDREVMEANQMVTGPIACTAEDLADRVKAFDMFRRSYRKNEAMEENRQLLKDKFARGKELGNDVNDSRNLIKQLTNKIEQIRKENAMRGLLDANGEIMKTPEEEKLQQQINSLKMKYQDQYTELRELKSEIERIQKLLERCKDKMQQDFELWLKVMVKQQSSNIMQMNNTSSTMNQSTAFNPGSTDVKVQQNLQDFYKARDAIYKDLK